MSRNSTLEITYRCSECNDTQVLRHSMDESPTNPFPHNGRECHAGMGTPFTEPLRKGMFPVSKHVVND